MASIMDRVKLYQDNQVKIDLAREEFKKQEQALKQGLPVLTETERAELVKESEKIKGELKPLTGQVESLQGKINDLTSRLSVIDKILNPVVKKSKVWEKSVIKDGEQVKVTIKNLTGTHKLLTFNLPYSNGQVKDSDWMQFVDGFKGVFGTDDATNTKNALRQQVRGEIKNLGLMFV